MSGARLLLLIYTFTTWRQITLPLFILKEFPEVYTEKQLDVHIQAKGHTAISIQAYTVYIIIRSV